MAATAPVYFRWCEAVKAVAAVPFFFFFAWLQGSSLYVLYCTINYWRLLPKAPKIFCYLVIDTRDPFGNAPFHVFESNKMFFSTERSDRSMAIEAYAHPDTTK